MSSKCGVYNCQRRYGHLGEHGFNTDFVRPKKATMNHNFRKWAAMLSEIRCGFCGEKIPMLRAMRGAKYCTATHQKSAAVSRYRGRLK